MPPFFRLLGVRVVVTGAPVPAGRCVFVCNHRSTFDHFALVVASATSRSSPANGCSTFRSWRASLRVLGAVPVDPADVRTTMATLTELARLSRRPERCGVSRRAAIRRRPAAPVSDRRLLPGDRSRCPRRSRDDRRHRRGHRAGVAPPDPGRSAPAGDDHDARALDPIDTSDLTVGDRRALRDRVQRRMERANGQHDAQRSGVLAGLLFGPSTAR